jgi:hypothetical protein
MTRPFSLGLLLFASGTAHAATTTFCMKVDTDNFSDTLWGDRWNGSDEPLYGIKIKVREYSLGGTYLGDVWTGYVSDVSGCVTVTVSTNNKYRVTIYSQAQVNGTNIAAYDGPDASYGLFVWAGTTDRFANQSYNVYPGFNEFLSMVSVGAYVMSRNNGGIQAYGLQYDASGSQTNCNGSSQDFIRCDSEDKYIASHETGHGVVRRRDDNQAPAYNWNADTGTCTAWMEPSAPSMNVQYRGAEEWFALEYAAAALKEGFANFYAAWAFNDSNTPGDLCELPYLGSEGTDLNLDRVGLGASGTDLKVREVYSCEGVPIDGLASWVGARNWLQELKVNSSCDEDLTGVGSIFDASRYFWDLRTDEGVPIGEIIDLYDLMDARNWSDNIDKTFKSRNPFCRLATAAANSSPNLTAEHNAQKNNGVDNGPCP